MKHQLLLSYTTGRTIKRVRPFCMGEWVYYAITIWQTDHLDGRARDHK